MSQPLAYQPLLLSSGLHASAARSPHKTAIISQEFRRTYGQLGARIRRVCGGASALGLQLGDRVAIFAPNCIEYPELVAGLTDAGSIVATLNPKSTGRELAAACDDCSARILFVHSSLAAVVSESSFRTIERVIYLGSDYEAWIAAAPERKASIGVDENAPFALVYSSGTTGKPKGIVISHRARALTFHAMAMEYGCYGPDDYQLGIAPMAHGAGLAFIMATLYFGGTVDVVTRFDPELVLSRMVSRPVTGVFMVPTHFQAIFSIEKPLLDRYMGKSQVLRTIISNAAALPQAMKEKIIAYWGCGKLHETYGSTEAGIVTNLRPQHQLTRVGSVGPAFALNEVRLLDDEANEVERGAIGELFSRSPYLFSGYWNQPEQTANSICNGWVSAGDLARQDDEGFIYIVDRKKDMVITGGLNVYPREIEEILHAFPSVVEAAVIGVPDNYFGEALVAYVVPQAGKNVSTSDLVAYCRRTLAGYKVPKQFRFIDALPRNAGGKVLKNDLRKMWAPGPRVVES